MFSARHCTSLLKWLPRFENSTYDLISKFNSILKKFKRLKNGCFKFLSSFWNKKFIASSSWAKFLISSWILWSFFLSLLLCISFKLCAAVFASSNRFSSWRNMLFSWFILLKSLNINVLYCIAKICYSRVVSW